MSSYYNDNDPGCVTWLENLIADDRIPAGRVDGRSIEEVTPDDLTGHHQVHLFAGIGGWPRAFDLAGWPRTEPAWTVSCPCQPFSSAGKRRGESDERHLWPVVRHLVAELRPPVVFGEQVASRLGRRWLARVRAEMEALGYAVGAADLCAAGAGAPHIRQRLWFVAVREGWRAPALGRGLADAEGQRRTVSQPEDFGPSDGEVNAPTDPSQPGGLGDSGGRQRRRVTSGPGGSVGSAGVRPPEPGRHGGTGGLEHSDRPGHDEQAIHPRRRRPGPAAADELRSAGGTAEPEGVHGRGMGATPRHRDQPGGSSPTNRVGEPNGNGLQGRRPADGGPSKPAQIPGAWDLCEFVWCRGDKARRIEPGTFPLAHGVPGRLVKLRGYGNAIVPPLAAIFVRAAVEAAA